MQGESNYSAAESNLKKDIDFPRLYQKLQGFLARYTDHDLLPFDPADPDMSLRKLEPAISAYMLQSPGNQKELAYHILPGADFGKALGIVSKNPEAIKEFYQAILKTAFDTGDCSYVKKAADAFKSDSYDKFLRSSPGGPITGPVCRAVSDVAYEFCDAELTDLVAGAFNDPCILRKSFRNHNISEFEDIISTVAYSAAHTMDTQAGRRVMTATSNLTGLWLNAYLTAARVASSETKEYDSFLMATGAFDLDDVIQPIYENNHLDKDRYVKLIARASYMTNDKLVVVSIGELIGDKSYANLYIPELEKFIMETSIQEKIITFCSVLNQKDLDRIMEIYEGQCISKIIVRSVAELANRTDACDLAQRYVAYLTSSEVLRELEESQNMMPLRLLQLSRKWNQDGNNL